LAAASLLGVFTSKYAYLFEKIFGVKQGVFLAVILPGLFYFLLAFILHPIVSIVLLIMAYGSMQVQKPIFSDYLNRHIQSRNRATVLSLINGVSGFYVAISGLLIGFIADISLSYAFIFMGGLITFSAFFIRIGETYVETHCQVS
jgi:MFS family permease